MVSRLERKKEAHNNFDSMILRLCCKLLEKIANPYHCVNVRNKLELRNRAELGYNEDTVLMSIQHTDFANEN